MRVEMYRNGERSPSRIYGFTDVDQASTLIRRDGKTVGILRLSDGLARKLLGAKWQSCPKAGQCPLRWRERDGYFASNLNGSIRLECQTCGYVDLVPSDHHLIHPDTTHLTRSTLRVAINEADWDERLNALIQTKRMGHLCICVRPHTSPVNTSAAAAMAAHPNARIVSESKDVIILRNVTA
jgi:hypothetical protein